MFERTVLSPVLEEGPAALSEVSAPGPGVQGDVEAAIETSPGGAGDGAGTGLMGVCVVPIRFNISYIRARLSSLPESRSNPVPGPQSETPRLSLQLSD